MMIVSAKNETFLRLNNWAMGTNATILSIHCEHIQNQINQMRLKYESNEDVLTDLDGLELYLRMISEGEKSQVEILRSLKEFNDQIFMKSFKL